MILAHHRPLLDLLDGIGSIILTVMTFKMWSMHHNH